MYPFVFILSSTLPVLGILSVFLDSFSVSSNKNVAHEGVEIQNDQKTLRNMSIRTAQM